MQLIDLLFIEKDKEVLGLNLKFLCSLQALVGAQVHKCTPTVSNHDF